MSFRVIVPENGAVILAYVSIASAFGLRYHLTETIPKLGGHTCRIDVKPIELTQLGRTPASDRQKT